MGGGRNQTAAACVFLSRCAHTAGVSKTETVQDALAEQALVEMARQDPEAFGQLYDLYFARIHSYIYRRVGDRPLAEDLTADTFFRALKAIKRYEWRGMPFSAWLYRIASNTVTDHFRSSRATNVPLDEQWGLQDAGEQPEDAALRIDRMEEILQAVRTLSPDQQDVVLLRFQGDLRLREIADIVGKSEGAVKALMFRALHTLRGRLSAKGEVYG